MDADVATNADFTIAATNRSLSEAEDGVNYNPSGVSHATFGTDSDMNDNYPSEIEGLIVVRDDLTFQNNARVRGSVIAGDDISSNGGSPGSRLPARRLYSPPPGLLGHFPKTVSRPLSVRKARLASKPPGVRCQAHYTSPDNAWLVLTPVTCHPVTYSPLHRRPLLDLLDCYRHAFPAEVGCRRSDRRAWSRPTPIASSGPAGRGTSRGRPGSCRPTDHAACSTHHRKLDRWLQLGGHADGQTRNRGSRPPRSPRGVRHDGLRLRADRRRLLPFDLDVHQIPARYDAAGRLIEDAHEHHDVRFLLVARAGQELATSDESHEVRWFTSDEVLRLTDEESVLRMLHKAARILN